MMSRIVSFSSRITRINKVRGFASSSVIFSQKDPIWLTLYAKQGCSLCDKAKEVLQQVRKDPSMTQKIKYQYVDITDPNNDQWWDAYCFDVPVLHVDRYNQKESIKFMHRLNAEKIIEEIEKY
ncbi:hypothetical protein WICMUC_003052 [Wickerhamomyces mucosus]|uniref:Glutaredoxin-like protein n=1 Tax=Wickerhamomyces mucosus TaxID=1378264 RepID=A0A9P8PPA8_9ASCO|nr:hypothetical protein WICMUC_003052 [Wickerhamomyces mucosus]